MKNSDYAVALTNARKIDDIIAGTILTEEYSSLCDKLKEYSKLAPKFNATVFSEEGSKKNNTLLTVLLSIISAFFGIIAILTIVSYNYGADDTILPPYILATIATILLVNLIFFLLIRKEKSTMALFGTIKPYISSKHIGYLTDITALTKISEKKVSTILVWAIDNGLIPSGKLVFENQVLLTTANLAEYYNNNKEECDEYFRYIIGLKNNIDERPQKLSDYLAARSIDVGYIQRDFNDSKVLVIENELAMIMAMVQQFVFAADLNTDCGEYCYYLLDYFLMSSERLLRAYAQNDNKSSKDAIGQAMSELNIVYDSYITCLLGAN